MKKTLACAVLALTFYTASAQSVEDSVKATINKMFTAMKSGDGNAFSACFADSAILQTITRTGNVRTEPIKAFAAQVSSLPKDSADERITFDAVKVDGPLAMAWTPYQFYYAGKFSHCGVNSFQLVRMNGLWKIQYIIDTRRRTGCQ